jgi:hypothetical protein
MTKYSQGSFRNSFEQRLFGTIRDTLRWCENYASTNGFPHVIKGDVYHNVRTDEFHGELSKTDTFAEPQSREIDVLLELNKPKRIRVLTSAKDSAHRQSLEHVGDYEALLTALRSSPKGWLYWAWIVARKGFQSGCEETGKRSDIALIPPITGSVDWLSVLTEEEVLERASDAVKIFVLGESWRRGTQSYRLGDMYNAIYVGTREPSGMPGTTKIRGSDGTDSPMREFVGEALKKPQNQFRIPLSGDRFYIPFFSPPIVQSMAKDGTIVSSPVASTIISSSNGIRFFRIRTNAGRELVADAQRGLYIIPPERNSRKIVRVDMLTVGDKILCANEDGTESRLETITAIEEINLN